MLSCQTGIHVCKPVHLRPTKQIKETRKAWVSRTSVFQNKEGGDISAAAIWIEAFHRKGKTGSTKTDQSCIFWPPLKLPFFVIKQNGFPEPVFGLCVEGGCGGERLGKAVFCFQSIKSRMMYCMTNALLELSSLQTDSSMKIIWHLVNT